MHHLNIIEKGTGHPNQLLVNGWDILAQQVSFPAAIIYQSKIKTNAKWMQEFANTNQVKLAPHGKTTMSPQLFKIQLDCGAWGISVATAVQAQTAYQAGAKHIILANQLVGNFNLDIISRILKCGDCKIYCFVDSIDNAKQLDLFFEAKNQHLNLFIEVGIQGGRCGCRSESQVIMLAQWIASSHVLRLRGLAFYEGVIHSSDTENTIKEWVTSIANLALTMKQQSLFYGDKIILTGAGSAWYDIVVKALNESDANKSIQSIIRPGCYLIHDTGIYQDAQNAVLARSKKANDIEETLESSLEIWAIVLSAPEPGLVIIGMGKRDVAFDAGLPTPRLFYRKNMAAPQMANKTWKLVEIMDQHCMMRVPLETTLIPGDLISFSTSHPCLTMDKWRHIGICNDHFVIVSQIDTYF